MALAAHGAVDLMELLLMSWFRARAGPGNGPGRGEACSVELGRLCPNKSRYVISHSRQAFGLQSLRVLPKPKIEQADDSNKQTAPELSFTQARPGDCLICQGRLQDEPAIRGRDILHGVPGEFAIHECPDCCAGTTLPRATDAELDAFYPKDYVPHEKPAGLLGRVMDVVQRMRMRNAPMSVTGEIGPGRALDVGCGRGDLGAELIRRGWKVWGIEPDPGAARVARERGLQVSAGIMQTAEVEVPADGFDLIVFQHCLEHVTDPGGDLRAALSMLAPDGRLIVTLPNWASWQRRAFLDRWFPLELPRHRTHWTPRALEIALRQAGAGQVETRTSTSFICFFWSLQYRFAGRLLTETGPALLAGYLISALLWPLAKILNAFGGGDFLHAIARK